MSGTTSTGQFVAENGEIIGSNGQPFIAKGIDLWYSDLTSTTVSEIPELFPGINMVRIYDDGYNPPASYATLVNQLTSEGIVVCIVDAQNYAGDGGGGSGTVFTGSDLTTELNWYTSMASYFKGNPYVWLGTNNEPSDTTANGTQSLAALSTWQQQTYNAIRATGNNNIVMVDEYGGGVPGTMGPNNGLTASDYASMTNIVWDLHYYGWVSNYSTNQATVDADLTGSAASGSGILGAESMPADGGTAPVIIGEFGNSTNGSTTDANWQQVVTAVETSGVGSTAWAWDGGGASDVLQQNGTLTTYGQDIAQDIAAAAKSTPPTTSNSSSTSTPSANDTVVTAGSSAAITDAHGNQWTVTSAGVVDENGQAAGYSSNVAEIAYVGGNIWQENTAGDWWEWGGSSWTGSGTTTSPLPATTTTTPPTTTTSTSTPSVNDTVVTAGSTAAITDAKGNQWTVTSAGVVDENGQAAGYSSNVAEIAYVGGNIWQENTAGDWWEWSGSSWSGSGTSTSPLPASTTTTPPATTSTSPPATTSTSAASPNDLVVLAGSGTTITDASGNTWSITSSGQVAVNGAADTTTANVTELAYVNGTIWQENTGNLWWGKTSPTASWSPSAGTSTNPLPAPVTIASGTASETVTQSQISVVATAGSHMLFISGSNDIVNLTGGTDKITDTGSGNTYVLPAAGHGSDTFTSDVLNNKGDMLDFKTALAATNWNGAASTLSNYLTVTNSSSGAVVSIAATSGGTGTSIATITGSTNLNLSTLLAHSIT